MLLTAFSYVGSILLDFNFVSPYTTLYEDLTFLLENDNAQRISSYAWLITSMLTFISIPLYILTFNKRLKWIHYLGSLFILAASAGFFITGWLGLEFSESINIAIKDDNSIFEDNVKLQLLSDFHEEQNFKRLASSSIGAFVILLGFSKFKIKSFPIFSTIFFIIAGPVLIFFNWYDPNHILRTAAMAVIAAGIIIFGIKLINSGLSPRIKRSKSKSAKIEELKNHQEKN